MTIPWKSIVGFKNHSIHANFEGDDKIDKSMSSSNIGGRKNRNIRDHLFVINGILNDVTKSKEVDVDLQIYDVQKCFHKLWYARSEKLMP